MEPRTCNVRGGDIDDTWPIKSVRFNVDDCSGTKIFAGLGEQVRSTHQVLHACADALPRELQLDGRQSILLRLLTIMTDMLVVDRRQLQTN